LRSLLDADFWIVAVLAMIVLPLLGRGRSAWFGLVNILGLWAWLGWQPAAASAALALFVWIWLYASSRIRRATPGFTLASFITILMLLGLFSLHKLHIDYGLGVHLPGGESRTVILGAFSALSLSYALLRAIDMAACVLYKGSPRLDLLSCHGYLFPFHMVLSGPVTGYQDYIAINEQRPSRMRVEKLLAGVNHIVTGLFYKYVIAEHLRIFAFTISGPIESNSIWDSAYLFVYIFFDFAGYSRIALGVGRLLDIPTAVNFRSPFAARTVTEFFTRWHMSLGSFIQRNIYTPLQMHLVRRWGIRRASRAGLIALVLAWIAVGVWHRFSLRLLGYGLGIDLLIFVYK
jgi:D-alanyl-lipoteichoic acid acyltransferase DltB (MBOAT superfamily)